MPEWSLIVLSLLLTAILALQSWILIKLVEHEKQLYRLVSDRESEKRTIASIHKDFESRIRGLEHDCKT